MRRVEVVVRFAGELLDVFRAPAGTTCWIGTTPVEAVAGTHVSFGHIAVTVAAVPSERELVPRRQIERRPYVYGALSVVAHAAIVMAALRTATSEPVSVPAIEDATSRQPGATRIKRFATPAQTVKRGPEPAPPEAPITTDHTPEQAVERNTPPPPETKEEVASALSGGGAVLDGPTNADDKSHFDPATSPAFDTVKVGDYSTVATGRTAGDNYAAHARNSSLVVITCDRASCLVLGGEKAVPLRRAVQARMAEITDCYKAAAASGGGTVDIDFAVDEAGTIRDVDIGEADPAGSCVAKIIRSLQLE